MSAETQAILADDDERFIRNWHAMTDAQRTAAGPLALSHYLKLTPEVTRTIDRLQSRLNVYDMHGASRNRQVLTDADVDFNDFSERAEHARVVPAQTLAEEGKRRMLLGDDAIVGLGFPWDKANGKVRIVPGKLVVWCGWTRHGKSNMAKQVMLHAIAGGERVCIASMEEETSDLWEDMGYMACGGDKPTVREIARWVEFQTFTLWFYDQQGMVSAAKIKSVIRYCAEVLHITQFVIDSLMMLAVNRDDYDAQSVFVGELKALAKDTKCTIHLICHLRKREGKTGEEQPGGMHDIAGGHEIGSKADYVFNVWRDRTRKDETKPECILTVEKQRGRINWIGKLTFDFHLGSRQYIEGKAPMTFWAAQPRDPGSDDE